MSGITVVDFDELLHKWAEHRLGQRGSQFVIDTSDIKIGQRSVTTDKFLQ